MKRFRHHMTQFGSRLFAVDRFHSLWQLDPESGCHIWTGSRNNAGYGFFGYFDLTRGRGQMMTAHRAALMMKLNRDIAPGMNANHWVCHNRLCVNPDHLEEGTQQEKLQAMREADLIRYRTGAAHQGAYNHQQYGRQYRYTVEEIAWVRDATVQEIVARYQVKKNRAQNMRWQFRHSYRWLPWPNRPQ